MEIKNKIILTLLTLSLILNCFSLWKINDMRKLIGHDYKYYLESAYTDDIENIMDMLEQIKQNQSWLSKMNIEHDNDVNGKQTVRFNWQIKDFTPNSEVEFYCRKTTDKNFQQLDVSLKSTGWFSAELEIYIEDEPQWNLSYYFDDEDYRALDDIYQSDDIISFEYEYYVILKDGNRIHTSEVEEVNLTKFIQIYSIMEAKIWLNKEKMPSYMELNLDIKGKNIPGKIILEIYNDNKMKEELIWNMDKPAIKWDLSLKTFDKITARTEFENGKIFKKELWNKINN